MIINDGLSNIIDYDSITLDKFDKLCIDTLATDNTNSHLTDAILITDNTNTIIGRSVPYYMSNKAIVEFPHKKLSAFNMLVFGNIFEYMNEKDMPTDVFVKYCKFVNRVDDLIGE